jgi:hypothetical protein
MRARTPDVSHLLRSRHRALRTPLRLCRSGVQNARALQRGKP